MIIVVFINMFRYFTHMSFRVKREIFYYIAEKDLSFQSR